MVYRWLTDGLEMVDRWFIDGNIGLYVVYRWFIDGCPRNPPEKKIPKPSIYDRCSHVFTWGETPGIKTMGGL